MRPIRQLRVIRQRVRSTRTGRLSLRIVVGVLGAMVVIIGFILVPLPGPGWLIVLAGLAILSAEFEWAQRLLAFTRARLEQWWHWLGRQHWTVRTAAGVVGIMLAGGVLAGSLWFGLGVRSVADLWP